jgi:hypothetical protein
MPKPLVQPEPGSIFAFAILSLVLMAILTLFHVQVSKPCTGRSELGLPEFVLWAFAITGFCLILPDFSSLPS